MQAAKPRPSIHVVLDTSCLFTEAADKLVNEEVSEFIRGAIGSRDVDVHWHLPWIVRAERQYQMSIRALRLISPLEKVERLLGHNLGITPEILNSRVEEAIARQVELHRINVVELDTQKVDWPEVVRRAAFREQPFSSGEHEKGFRDAIVLEAFCQLVETLPRSSQSCRIVFLCADELLAEAARERISGRTNVAVVAELGAVRTILNALTSELTQEMVNAIVPKVGEIFFIVEDRSTLYYKAAVREKINEKFGKLLAEQPGDGFQARTEKALIGSTTFLGKHGQRVSLSTRVTYVMTARKVVWRTPVPGLLGALGVGATGPSIGAPSTGFSAPSTAIGATGLSIGQALAGLGGTPLGSIGSSTSSIPVLTPPPPGAIAESW